MLGIYGANGFIGKHLVRKLARAGIPVRAVSRHFDEAFVAELGESVEFLVANLADPIGMASSLQGIDTVVQLVSTSSPGLQNNHLIADIEDNVIPHVNFLQNCLQLGVRRYVFISSGGTVYGAGDGTAFRETDDTSPICSHGLTKLFVEKYIRMYGYLHGIDYAILRLSNPFGPGQEFRKGQGLIPAVMAHYRKNLPVHIYGDGNARRDYIYIDDVIDAIEAAIAARHVPKMILNIGSGKTHSILEVIEEIERTVGSTFERIYLEPRGTDVDVSLLDIRDAERILHWTPTVPFADGIRKTFEAP